LKVPPRAAADDMDDDVDSGLYLQRAGFPEMVRSFEAPPHYCVCVFDFLVVSSPCFCIMPTGRGLVATRLHSRSKAFRFVWICKRLLLLLGRCMLLECCGVAGSLEQVHLGGRVETSGRARERLPWLFEDARPRCWASGEGSAS
jgi:hypothetical protein